MAHSSTTYKPPPITTTLSYELLKKIRLLNTKLAASIVHITLTAEVEEKLEDTAFIQQELTLDETKKIFEFLCAQEKNKELEAEEILAIEEYKIVLLEACRTAISKSAAVSFDLRPEIYTPISTLKQNLPAIKFKLIQQKNIHVTLEQLNKEFTLIIEEENKPKESKKRKEINEALKIYKQAILDTPLYKYSGITESHNRSETKKSAWKKTLKRIGYSIQLALQLISGAVYNIVEMTGAQSLLLLIPGIPNPVAWIIAISLITISLIIEISFSLKLFKETYGFSYLWRDTKTYLQAAEKVLPLTQNINDQLRYDASLEEMDVKTYTQFTEIADLANSDVTNKTANADSPFSLFKEEPLRAVIRASMLFVNAVMAVSGAYFVGTLLLNTFAPAFFVALGLGPVGITVCTIGFLVVLSGIFIAQGIYQYREPIFHAINRGAKRFEQIQTFGKSIVDNISAHKDSFAWNIFKKEEPNTQRAENDALRAENDALRAENNTLLGKSVVVSEGSLTASNSEITKAEKLPTFSSGILRHTLHGSSSNSSSRSASTESLTDVDNPKLSPRT